jgi:hypothetical protein
MAKTRRNAPRGRGESEQSNKIRARDGWEESSDESDIVQKLLEGSDEQRESILAGLGSLSPFDKEFLRARLKDAILRIRERKSLQAYTGWLISALALVASDDQDAFVLVAQHVDQKLENNEWVRYWALAQLYWTRPTAEVLDLLLELGSVEDRSSLVRELAQAIVRKARAEGPETFPVDLRRGDIFARLRALQIVADPGNAPGLVQFLQSRPDGNLAYETLRALTATPEVTKVAAEALARTISSEVLVPLVTHASTGAKPEFLKHFALLFQRYRRTEVEDLLRNAFRREGISTSGIARQLLDAAQFDDHTPATPHAAGLPPGAWRAELAYRSVLKRPTTFELLESLSATQLSSVLQDAGLTTTDTAPGKLAELAQSIAPGGPPNPLWLAWIKNVHATRLTQD